jgi:hypothetical protein
MSLATVPVPVPVASSAGVCAPASMSANELELEPEPVVVAAVPPLDNADVDAPAAAGGSWICCWSWMIWPIRPIAASRDIDW